MKTKRTISVETVVTILRGALPDAIMSRLTMMFTTCRVMSHCQAGALIPFPVPDDRRFCFDNVAFLNPVPTLSAKDRKVALEQWNDTMMTIDEYLGVISTDPPYVQVGFAEIARRRFNNLLLITSRNSVKGLSTLFEVSILRKSLV